MTWGGRQMGAGRRVACAHCGDPLLVQPNELDALEHGDVRCPRCGRALNANDLFREMTTASAFTQLQLTSNWWEADQLEVRVGVGQLVRLQRPVVGMTVHARSLSSGLSVVAQVVDAISFWVIPFVTDPSAPTVQGAVGWQALGRIEESGVPAWLDFLDAARAAIAQHNGRAAVLEIHAALDA